MVLWTVGISHERNKELVMEEEQRRAAKRQLIALMQAGHSWQEAAAMAGMGILPNCANPYASGSK